MWQGLTAEDATRTARAALSADDVLARHLASLRQAHWTDPAPPAPNRPFSLGGLSADARQAVRALRTSPSITIAALVVLAPGIGATTAIFSVLDAVVLREGNDAGALVAAGVALSAAALVACVVPAHRAATVDPTVARRSE